MLGGKQNSETASVPQSEAAPADDFDDDIPF
jgi:hypothetical protein